MHIGITEEIFATERLAPARTAKWTELWPRFRGGSTPDDNLPTPAEIRSVLSGAREHLKQTLSSYAEDRLDEIPAALAPRKLTRAARQAGGRAAVVVRRARKNSGPNPNREKE